MKTYTIAILATLFIISDSYSSQGTPLSAEGKVIAAALQETLKKMASLSQLEAIEASVKLLTTQITELNGKDASTTTKFDTITKTLKELQDSLAVTDENVDTLNNHLLALDKSIEEIENDLASLHEKLNNRTHNEDSSSKAEITEPQNVVSDAQEVASSSSSESTAHQASVQAIQEQYIKKTAALSEMQQLQQTLMNMCNTLQAAGQAAEQNNQETVASLIALCDKVEKESHNLHNIIKTPPIESQLLDLTKKHAVHLDSVGASCMICYLVWKILEKPNKILPRISVETKTPIIKFCKNVSASAVFNATLNRVRGTSKNGWKCMGIFACLDIITPRIQAYLEQYAIAHSWIKKPAKNKALFPYISWFVKSSIAHLLA